MKDKKPLFTQGRKMNIGIYIYDNAEVLDFSGPYEVFTTANRVCSPSPFNVFLIAESLNLTKSPCNWCQQGVMIFNHIEFIQY